MYADASAGKAVGASAAPIAVKQAEEKPKSAPAKAVGDQRKDEHQDTDIEAGEVDAKKGNLLRPDAPEFKPGKEDSSASAAAALTSSKRKEAEQASSTQVWPKCDSALTIAVLRIFYVRRTNQHGKVRFSQQHWLLFQRQDTDVHSSQAKEQERRRASDKGERASKRQRTSDIEVCGPPVQSRLLDKEYQHDYAVHTGCKCSRLHHFVMLYVPHYFCSKSTHTLTGWGARGCSACCEQGAGCCGTAAAPCQR